MKQLFMNIFDITPTEGKWVEMHKLEEYVDEDEIYMTKYTDVLDSIRREGALNAIKVHPNGFIADGNFRYWSYRHLYEETKDDKWKYIPIDHFFYFGNYNPKPDVMTLRESLIKQAPANMIKMKTIPSETELKEYDDNKLGHGYHPYCNIKDLIAIGVKREM